MSDTIELPSVDDVRDAARTLEGHAFKTPVIESDHLNGLVGGRVLFKCECLQRVGAFKFRGAYNAVSRIDRQMYPGGVVACSSGNHAQGIAEAARLLGVAAVVVMPEDAPALKAARTRRSGAEVVLYDRTSEDRFAIASAIGEQRGAQFVAPFNDFNVIAGQGTAGLELCEQASDLGLSLDEVLVPASGGGFCSGVALAVASHFPGAKVRALEPTGFERIARSLEADEITENATVAGSICDALMANAMGNLTFGIGRELFAKPVSVGDDDVRAAMRFAYRELKLVVEPGGATGLAAVLNGQVAAKGKTIGVMLSGGNVDPALFAEILSESDGAVA